MSRTINASDSENAENNQERLMGKRHNYDHASKRSFESIALSIGFSKEELRGLGRFYSKASGVDLGSSRNRTQK